MNRLGRAIPEEIQIDTCDLVNEDEHLETIITAQNKKKRHSEQRSNNKAKKQDSNDISKILHKLQKIKRKLL